MELFNRLQSIWSVMPNSLWRLSKRCMMSFISCFIAFFVRMLRFYPSTCVRLLEYLCEITAVQWVDYSSIALRLLYFSRNRQIR